MIIMSLNIIIMYNHVVKYDDHVVGEVGRVQVHVQRGDHRGEGQGGERGHAVSSSVFYMGNTMPPVS